MENNRLIKPIQQFRPERTLRLRHQLITQHIVTRLRRLRRKPQRMPFLRKIKSQVRRANNNRVAKINDAPLPIRQPPIIQNLQQHIHHIAIRLFKLIKKHHRIRPPPHLLRQLSTLIIPHISWRRTHQSARRILLLKLRHVQRNQRLLIPIHSLRQHLRQMRLPYPRRPQKQKTPNRPLRIRQKRPTPPQRPRNRLNRLALPHNNVPKRRLHPQQRLRRHRVHPLHRHPAHHAHRLGNIIRPNLNRFLRMRRLPRLVRRIKRRRRLPNLLSILRRLIKIPSLHRGIFLNPQLVNRLPPLNKLLRPRPHIHPHPRPRLINRINRLIRQQPRRQIPRRQLHRRLKRPLRILHHMMRLIRLRNPLQNLYRIFLRRLIHNHRLKTPLQRRIFFNGLVIFLQRCRAHNLHFAPRQRRLQNIRRVHRTFRTARAHHRMQLIQKQNHIPRTLRLIQNLLQPLLKLPTILRPRNHPRQIQRHNPLVLHPLRHIPRTHRLRQPLHNRRLPNARLTNQHRIVLRPPAQHLHNPLQFLLAPNHRVQRPLPRHLRQILPKRIERRRLLFLLHATRARPFRGTFPAPILLPFTLVRTLLYRLTRRSILLIRHPNIEQQLRRAIIPLIQNRLHQIRRPNHIPRPHTHRRHLQNLLRPRRKWYPPLLQHPGRRPRYHVFERLRQILNR